MSSSPVIQDSIEISAYHAGISQYIYSLLHSIQPNSSSMNQETDAIESETSQKSRSSSPNQISRRRSTLKVQKGESLLDPNLTVEITIKDKPKPDLLKENNIRKLSPTPIQSSTTTRSIVSSKSTQQSINQSITTEFKAESSITSKNENLRGRMKSKSRTSSNIQAEEQFRVRGNLQRSNSYDIKREVKFAKNRDKVENKVKSWWKEVVDSIPAGSSFADLQPEVDDSTQSPEMERLITPGTGSELDTFVTSRPASPTSTKLPPLIVHENYPDSQNQSNITSTSKSKDIYDSSIISSCLNAIPDIGKNTIKSTTSTTTTKNSCKPKYTPLTFSTKSCKATLKYTNLNLNSKSDNINNKDSWLLDCLGESKNWDIPFKPEEQNKLRKITNERRNKPIKVVVTGEMPTPKPINTGQVLWG